MNTYLAIITTILVFTQIIRVTQNYISLRDINVKKEDFENQKKAYKLIVEKLERELMQEETI